MLWPFKTNLEISDLGIDNHGKKVKWEDITEFSYGIQIINGANNYVITYKDKNGKKSTLNYIVSLVGSKKKKEMFAEIYALLERGFTTKLLNPMVANLKAKVDAGETVNLCKCEVNNSGITIQKGMLKKEAVHIPWEEVELSSPEGSGNLVITSSANKKDTMAIPFLHNTEIRPLDLLIKQMVFATI